MTRVALYARYSSDNQSLSSIEDQFRICRDQAARAKQRPWDLGKDFEQSAVLSPIVPVAESGHPATGLLELRVDGETRQSTDLSLLVWSVAELIAHLSRFYHLEPGDLIYTGTPEGVGPVVAGQRIEGSIAGLGGISLTIA